MCETRMPDSSKGLQLQWDNQCYVEGDSYALKKTEERFDGRIARYPVSGPFAVISEDPLVHVGAAAWSFANRIPVLLVTGNRFDETLRLELERRGFGLFDDREGLFVQAQHPAPPGHEVFLLTSGTTGPPKIIQYKWPALFTMGKVNLPDLRWLLVYEPGTYAWFQIVTCFMFGKHQEVVISQSDDRPQLINECYRMEVTAISSTPTFWRMLQMTVRETALQSIPLEQITLGGERVDQEILDYLSGLYPQARISHIFASTETGFALCVNDKQAGFPAAWLDNADKRVGLSVRNGTLWVRSPHAAQDNQGWVDTGDCVKLEGDRVYIVGRKECNVINTGGRKAYACDIYDVLITHPKVLWCRIKPVEAPFVGQLVGADIVVQPEYEQEDFNEQEYHSFCARVLPDHMVPRVWHRLTNIPVHTSLKSA